MNDSENYAFSLPATERLKVFLSSGDEIFHLHCIMCIAESLQTCDLDFISAYIVPSIAKFAASDSLQVLRFLLSALPDIGESLFEHFPDHAEDILITYVLPVVHGVIAERSDAVCESVSECWACLITILDSADFLSSEIPALKKFAASSQKDVRIVVITVLSFLVDFFNPNVWYSHLFDVINQLSSDHAGSVRCHVPPLIAQYSRRLESPRELAQLAGRFSLFCRDSHTAVRKSAAESLVALSESLDQGNRLITIYPAIQLLLTDPAEIVRSIVTKNLGPLISSLGPTADAALVQKYCASLISKDISIAFPAAFAFPAVALTLGKERFGEIKIGFEAASMSKEYRIRRTLAFGLLSFGYILERSECEVIVENFLRDIPSVAIGIMTNLNLIVPLVDDKEALLFCLTEPALKYSNEWRMRLRVSEQLRYCAEKFDHEKLRESAKELLRDPVAVVRKDAVLSFAHLMENEDLDFLVELIKSESFVDREIAAMVYEYADIEKVSDFLYYLINLATDPVVNVRINAASAICSIINAESERANDFEEIAEKLKEDEDADVRAAILCNFSC